jgi:hypothetical protein
VVHHQIDDCFDRELTNTAIHASSVRIYFDRNSQARRVDVRERIATRTSQRDT